MTISASLQYLSNLDTPAWYHVGRNLKRLEKATDELNTAKNSIVEKFIQKDEKGNPIYIDENKTMYDLGKKQVEADKLWAELQEEKIEVEFYPIKFELLKDLKLNAAKITSLIDTVIIED